MVWKIIISAILVIVLVVIVGFVIANRQTYTELPASNIPVGNSETIPPPPSESNKPEYENLAPAPNGDPEDTAKAINIFLEKEDSSLGQTEEVGSISGESQALDDFGKPYDESAF